MLKEIGVKVDIVDVPVAKFQDGSVLSKHEFEIIAFSWIGTPYPFQGISQIYGTGSDSNYSQLSDPRIDENAKKLDSETDVAARIKLANETAKIIWENVMTLPLYQRPELIAVKTKLANYGAVRPEQRRSGRTWATRSSPLPAHAAAEPEGPVDLPPAPRPFSPRPVADQDYVKSQHGRSRAVAVRARRTGTPA